MQLLPKDVSPLGRGWKSGKQVTCVTKNGRWKLGLILSNGCGRFSAGWNQFVRENKLTTGKTLVFNMVSNCDEVVFNIEL